MEREVTYLRVEWHHDHPEEPVLLFTALDEGRWEVRKVDVWSDGSGCVSDSTDDVETQSTWLASVPVPGLADINADPQFDATEISKADFDAVWVKYDRN